MRHFVIFSVLILLFSKANSQPYFPADDLVFNDIILPRIDISIAEDSLDWLYNHVNEDHEFKANFIFSTPTTNDTIENIGFRLRGKTSRKSNKKSFKVSFNTFVSGRKYHDLEKMNLNGEHNDPSIIRSYLAWNIFESNRVPCSRANHVNLYINNRYYGLYMNVEQIDEEFVENRFGNKLGNLYKCIYPADLSYLGNNQNAYKSSGYELKMNTDEDDFSDLMKFTEILATTSPSEMTELIEPIFNINGFIRYLTVEIFTGHWDAYTFGRNNFYLYNNAYTGKFEFLPYDLDNTFGIDWFIGDVATRNIYEWWPKGDERVLSYKTMQNQIYRDRFSFLLNKLIENYANENNLTLQIDSTRTKIENSAKLDAYRSMDYHWSFDDFLLSFESALGDHVKYGLKEYIIKRIQSIKEQLVLNPIAPIIENTYHNYPSIGDAIRIKTDVTDDGGYVNVKVYYQFNGSAIQSLVMKIENEVNYSVELPVIHESGIVAFYVEATDDSGNIAREPSIGHYTIKLGTSNTNLIINEFLASNNGLIFDNYGESEDWIEILNNGAEELNLKGKYLSDDIHDPNKWELPDVLLKPNEYYLIWADNDTEQGRNHANFKLSNSGEYLGLYDSFESNYAPIDTLSFGQQQTNYSLGRNIEGEVKTQNFITPGGENESANLAYINISYNMTKQIDNNNFDSEKDYIDIVGDFNHWNGTQAFYDGDADGLINTSLFGFKKGAVIQYKARINSKIIEFEYTNNQYNRQFSITNGENVIAHWFNDDILDIQARQMETEIMIFPNPVINSPIKVNSSTMILEISIYNGEGKLELKQKFEKCKSVQINTNLDAGVHYMLINTINGSFTQKVVVN